MCECRLTFNNFRDDNLMFKNNFLIINALLLG